MRADPLLAAVVPPADRGLAIRGTAAWGLRACRGRGADSTREVLVGAIADADGKRLRVGPPLSIASRLLAWVFSGRPSPSESSSMMIGMTVRPACRPAATPVGCTGPSLPLPAEVVPSGSLMPADPLKERTAAAGPLAGGAVAVAVHPAGRVSAPGRLSRGAWPCRPRP